MVTRAEWYARVTATWPPGELPALTDAEALKATRKLYRFAKGRTCRLQVRIGTGNTVTGYETHGGIVVNPNRVRRGPMRHRAGWEDVVHLLSHAFYSGPHGGQHARFEMRMIKEVIKRGWLSGTLRTAPPAVAPAADPRDVKRARTVAAIGRWEAKERRATNALRKLRRSLAAQDRAILNRSKQT